jgi:hypothetical protein
MRKGVVGLLVLIVLHFNSRAQVDTSYVYNTSTPYGTLDIRIAKSSTRYYYLQENKTIAFRESSPGVKTNTYRDMTAWDSSPYTEGNLREKNGTSDAFVMNYRLLYPLNYNQTYSPGYPLIVFLHGAGERGNCWKSTCYHADASWNPNTNSPAAPTDPTSKLLNNDHNLLHGGSTHLSVRNAAQGKLPNDPTLSSRAFPGFVLFPQNLNGWTANSVQDAIKLVRLVAKKYNIDENRIYIEGLSNGGYATYESIKRAPWLFASSITMSAVSDASITYYNYQSKIAHIPMWTFQGGQDTDPTPARTEGYVKKFRAAGAVVRYTKYDNLGHGTWNTAMKEADFFKWMLSQNKSNIHTFGGSTAICGTNSQGVQMFLSEGFKAYQWEKNGVIISGATTSKYTATTTGTYRARFSRKANPTAADWNQWSKAVTITNVNPPQAQVDQIGTVVLKDLNGLNDARLKAVGDYAKYQWYKNGVLLSVPDSNNAPIFKSTSGNGAYTLVVSGFDGCPSPASKPKYIFFNDSAPVNLTAPGSFAGSLPNSSSIRLTWTDPSTAETGFEIWRRKATSSTTFTPWEMRTLTAANVTSFTDTGVEPSTTYSYKIRAVSNTGRSNYTPATSDLKVSTGGDSTPPSAPTNLTASATGIKTITLKWTASTDNSGIKQYRIYYGSTSVATGTAVTTYTISNLNLNTNYTFTVKAEDLGGNLSAASNSASANTYVNGLYYEHSTGAWTDLDEINWTAPAEFKGTVTTFSIAPRTQEDYFNFEFDGYLYINTAGTYYLQTTSSDGSRIELDGAMVVNNDGVHASRTITSAAVTLSAGPHRINVKYFELDESHVLTVRYKGPDTGNSFITIPSTALKSGTSSSGRIATTETTTTATTFSTATVYPNPTTAQDINVQVESEDPAPVYMKLIDFTGRQIYQGEFNVSDVNEGIRLMPTENMKDGIYLLIIQQKDRITQHRISIKN